MAGNRIGAIKSSHHLAQIILFYRFISHGTMQQFFINKFNTAFANMVGTSIVFTLSIIHSLQLFPIDFRDIANGVRSQLIERIAADKLGFYCYTRQQVAVYRNS